jgi:hypothetical protein
MIIKLGRKRIGTALAELDDGTGELPPRMLRPINDIEALRRAFGQFGLS